MKRFYMYAQKSVQLNAEENAYLEKQGSIKPFSTGDYFMLPGDRRSYWVFVLTGLAAGIDYDGEGRELFRWVTPPGDYFTGTTHPFSQTGQKLTIRFLRPTVVFMLSLEQFKYAQQHLPGFAELIQVLKQKRIRTLQGMLNIRDYPKRRCYEALYTELPTHFKAMADPEMIRFLQVDRSTFFRSKAAFKAQKRG